MSFISESDVEAGGLLFTSLIPIGWFAAGGRGIEKLPYESRTEEAMAQLRPMRRAGSWPLRTFLKTAIRDMPSMAAASGSEKKSFAIFIPPLPVRLVHAGCWVTYVNQIIISYKNVNYYIE